MDEICVADYDQKPHVVIYMRQAEGKVPGNPLVVPSCPWPNESLLRHAGVPPLGGGGVYVPIFLRFTVYIFPHRRSACSTLSVVHRVNVSLQEGSSVLIRKCS